jgi:hypothetical protein
MRDADTEAAGFLIDSAVSDDGVARLRLAVTDSVAQRKLASRVYSGCVVTFDGDEVSDISLVDAPVDFVGEFAKRAPDVVAKIYDGGSMKAKKLAKRAAKLARETGQPYELCFKTLRDLRPAPAPAAPPAASPSMQKALDALAVAQSAVTGAVDKMAAQAAVGRAVTGCQIEIIKSARQRPCAYGDLQLVSFLRHGRR